MIHDNKYKTRMVWKKEARGISMGTLYYPLSNTRLNLRYPSPTAAFPSSWNPRPPSPPPPVAFRQVVFDPVSGGLSRRIPAAARPRLAFRPTSELQRARVFRVRSAACCWGVWAMEFRPSDSSGEVSFVFFFLVVVGFLNWGLGLGFGFSMQKIWFFFFQNNVW